jgi:phosphoglycolate phosphatase-like HAD superfamily hydrolase
MLDQLLQSKAIIFDCDGVILDSNAIKSNAFGKAIEAESPELVDTFIKYHKENGGISRYVKFEYFYKELKQQFEYKINLKAALKRYAHISENGLLTCDMITGVLDILKHFKSLNIPCYVVSGGDQKEVRSVFKKRNLDQYFVKILGSPNTKVENLDKLKSYDVSLENNFFFGDASSDMNAALGEKMNFIFVSGKSEWSAGRDECNRLSLPIIENFLHLFQDTK